MAKDTAKKAENDEIIEKKNNSGSMEIPNAKNAIIKQIDDTNKNSIFQSKPTDLIEEFLVPVSKEKSLITDIQLKNEDVPLVEDSNSKINTDNIDTIVNIHITNNSGIVSDNIDG